MKAIQSQNDDYSLMNFRNSSCHSIDCTIEKKIEKTVDLFNTILKGIIAYSKTTRLSFHKTVRDLIFNGKFII